MHDDSDSEDDLSWLISAHQFAKETGGYRKPCVDELYFLCIEGKWRCIVERARKATKLDVLCYRAAMALEAWCGEEDAKAHSWTMYSTTQPTENN